MKNRYFDITKDTDFIYANAILLNINYALISLEMIKNKERYYEIGIFHDEHTFYFYHIQNILTACGNLCNVFDNKTKRNKKLRGSEISNRSERLKEKFGIIKDDYKYVFLKDGRNTNEHFDERYQEFDYALGDFNLLYDDMDQSLRHTILSNVHLRTYDVSNYIYYSYDANKNPISYNMLDLYEELFKMREKIEDNPSLNSAWLDENPTETLK